MTMRLARDAAIFLATFALFGCVERGVARIPGASGPFPDAFSDYRVSETVDGLLDIRSPVDDRNNHYGKPIEGTAWTSCSEDAGLGDSVPEVVQGYLEKQIEASGLFAKSSNRTFTLDSEIWAFCAHAKGFLIVRVAGVVGIRFKLYEGGSLVSERYFEKVVADNDPEYSGSNISFIEQGMKHTLADALRVVTVEYIKELESSIGSPMHTSR